MGNEAGLDKPRYEKEWSAQEARLKLSPEDRAAWDSASFTIRPYVYFNKIFIVWEFFGGQAHIKNSFTVISMDASFRDGIWVRVRDQDGNESVINHTPRLLGRLNVFAWIPYFNEIRYHSNEWNDPTAPKALRLAVCFKTQHNPSEPLREGSTYISELHHFRSQFPGFAKVRF